MSPVKVQCSFTACQTCSSLPPCCWLLSRSEELSYSWSAGKSLWTRRINKLRRFWIVVFAACGIALLVAVFIRNAIPGNVAIQTSTQLALESQQVQALLGIPIRYNGFRGGGYKGVGEGSHVSATTQFKGSKQAGTLHAYAIKLDGQWQLVYSELIAENNISVPLTNGGSDPCQP
jgi:hypothetical protein